jgi:hypothetical protein
LYVAAVLVLGGAGGGAIGFAAGIGGMGFASGSGTGAGLIAEGGCDFCAGATWPGVKYFVAGRHKSH